jgi:hypothetical protein
MKWVVIIIVVAVVGNVVKEALKADKEVDGRIALKGSCARQAQAGGVVPADKIDAVCSCAVDRTAKALGPTRFIRLAEVTKATEADKQVLLESLAACIAERVPSR